MEMRKSKGNCNMYSSYLNGQFFIFLNSLRVGLDGEKLDLCICSLTLSIYCRCDVER